MSAMLPRRNVGGGGGDDLLNELRAKSSGLKKSAGTNILSQSSGAAIGSNKSDSKDGANGNDRGSGVFPSPLNLRKTAGFIPAPIPKTKSDPALPILRKP